MIPKKNYQVTYQNIKNKKFLIKQNLCFEINDVGFDVWYLSDGVRNFEDILESIAIKYSTNKDDIRKDIEFYIDQLLAQNIILKGGESND